MKKKLNISTVVLALFGFIAVQTATAQAPNPHPAHEALKGLQPFIGNWASEFEAHGGFEGLEKGRIVTGSNRFGWILNKTAVKGTWDNKFKDNGKTFNFGTTIITLDPLSKKFNCNTFGYDGKVYWTGKGVMEIKDKVLHFDMEENTINKTNTKYQSTRRKTNRNTTIVHHKNLVQNGKKIGDLKENKLTRVPFKKKPAQSVVSAGEAEKITAEITQLTERWSQVFANKDFDHLKRIWADDFSYTMPGGIVSDKKTGLANVADKSDTITSAGLVAFKAHVYSKNLVIGNGDHHEAGKDKDGKPFSRKFRFTNVWVQRNGKWQVVRGHSSELDLATGPTQSAVSAGEAEKISEVITKLDQQWAKASLTKDTAFLKSIWADDGIRFTRHDGTVFDKEAALADWEDNADTVTSAVTAPFKVRVYGKNFAVAAGDYHETGKDKDGKPFSRKFRFTDVWVRKQMSTGERKWQVVAGHASELK